MCSRLSLHISKFDTLLVWCCSYLLRNKLLIVPWQHTKWEDIYWKRNKTVSEHTHTHTYGRTHNFRVGIVQVRTKFEWCKQWFEYIVLFPLLFFCLSNALFILLIQMASRLRHYFAFTKRQHSVLHCIVLNSIADVLSGSLVAFLHCNCGLWLNHFKAWPTHTHTQKVKCEK